VFVRPRPLDWTSRLAYAVGLMATDGCLSRDGRHLFFDSMDAQLVEALLSCVGRPVHYGSVRTRSGRVQYRASFSDVELYRWLVAVGLTPAKSLSLGAIDVPDRWLLPLVRGLLDGDGSIVNFVHAPTVKAYPEYRYERLMAQFNSASRPHLEWLRTRLLPALDSDGSISVRGAKPPRREFYSLHYGKHASIQLFELLYSENDVPCLLRKRRIWDAYRVRHGADGGT
jgi:hypothetical protein